MVGERGTFLSDWTRGAHHAVDVGIMYVAHGLFGLDGMLRLYNSMETIGMLRLYNVLATNFIFGIESSELFVAHPTTPHPIPWHASAVQCFGNRWQTGWMEERRAAEGDVGYEGTFPLR